MGGFYPEPAKLNQGSAVLIDPLNFNTSSSVTSNPIVFGADADNGPKMASRANKGGAPVEEQIEIDHRRKGKSIVS